MSLRLFLALDFDSNVRKKIAEEISSLQISSSFRIVPPENLHLTIRFLGSVEEDKIKPIQEALERTLKSFTGFECSLRGIGGFPNETKARIVWFGVSKGFLECVELEKKVDQAISPLGFSRTEMNFIPHLTVARAKTKLQSIRSGSEFGEIPCGKFGELTMFSSDLSAKTPVYQPIFKIHFKEL